MRILLIEDHPIVRAGCRRLLQGRGNTDIAEAATAAEGVSIARQFAPDIIVLDLKLPDGSGLELLGSLMANEAKWKIIVFSMYEDPAFVIRALESGAAGYLTKNDDPEVLLEAIENVVEGRVFLTVQMAEKLALLTAGRGNETQHDLSRRELEVLELLGLGKTLSEIAAHLKVSYRTSASVVAQIKDKLNVASTPALIKWAVDHQRIRDGAS